MPSARIRKRCVLMIDPKGVIAKGGRDVIERHINYAGFLRKFSDPHEIHFVIIGLQSKSDVINIIDEDNFHFASYADSSWNRIIFPFLVRNFITNSNLEVTFIVAGDPWLTSISSILFKKLFARKSKLQIQIHSDVPRKNPKVYRTKDFAKFQFMHLSLRFADQVRVMNQPSAKNIVVKFGVDSERVLTAPVPYRFPDKFIPRNKLSKENLSFGFVGRIEMDRGLNEFIIILGLIVKVFPGSKFVIAGSGPLEDWFRSKIRASYPDAKVEWMGHLNQDELSGLWDSLDALISTARSESFGRSIREAISNGVPVIGFPTTGISTLSSNVRNNMVVQLDGIESFLDVQTIFQGLRKCEFSLDIYEELRHENNESIQMLVKSWIT